MKSFKQYTEGFETPKKTVPGSATPPKGTYAWNRLYGKYTAKGELRKRPNPNKPPLKEDGGAMAAAPTNSVAGVAGSGDSRLPAAQREPGVSKKRNPIMKGLVRRNLPNV